MNGQTWHDWGFDNFMTRTIPLSNRLSSIGARNLIPIGGISPSRLVSPLNATTDIVFSSTDNDTAAWASGTIYFADGTNSGTMDSGNTGNISATTYVYYDREILGVLQTTTTVSNATGVNKLLVAIVEEGASGKDCKITPTIAAGLNVSGITANQISVNQLDALAVNTGTLTVDESITAGGSTDGIIYVKDSSNNTKVQLDQDGITINTGKMTIKDSGETTIIDSAGLVSTASFASATATKTASQTITGTAVADITSLTHTFTASSTRTTKVLFMSTITGYHNDADGQLIFNFDLDNADIGPSFVVGQVATAQVSQTASAQFIYSVTSGEHTIKMQARGNNASPSTGLVEAAFLSATLSYVVLGK